MSSVSECTPGPEAAAETGAGFRHEASSKALAAAEPDARQAQITVADLVLDAATMVFEAGGASAVDRVRSVDRHWRNARTISAHNPIIHKERSVGDFRIKGSLPEFEWSAVVVSGEAKEYLPAG